MSEERGEDWLRVVYGTGVVRGAGVGVEEPAREREVGGDIVVRQSPSELDPAQAPGGQQQVRVTVVPATRNQRWSLYLWDFGGTPGHRSTRRVWWRVAPGPWEPLVGTRQCASGRGRARVDVELRVERTLRSDAPPPRLRFVAEAM